MNTLDLLLKVAIAVASINTDWMLDVLLKACLIAPYVIFATIIACACVPWWMGE